VVCFVSPKRIMVSSRWFTPLFLMNELNSNVPRLGPQINGQNPSRHGTFRSWFPSQVFIIWGFPIDAVPQIIQVIRTWLSIETTMVNLGFTFLRPTHY
jgi:hypothetical protein